jgi:hypothetical protein
MDLRTLHALRVYTDRSTKIWLVNSDLSVEIPSMIEWI